MTSPAHMTLVRPSMPASPRADPPRTHVQTALGIAMDVDEDEQYDTMRCQFDGCSKPRRTTGQPFCKKHGGGRRCQHDECQQAATGTKDGVAYCAAHGGSKRCASEGCNKLARPSADGTTLLCAAHGGGKRCQEIGCIKGARGGSNGQYCAAHGGGRRCRHEGCKKSAADGDLCIAHGGGKRCEFAGGYSASSAHACIGHPPCRPTRRHMT
jgi:hypothetical protein